MAIQTKKAYGRHGNTDKDSHVLKWHLFSGDVLWTPRCVFSSAPLRSAQRSRLRNSAVSTSMQHWMATCKISKIRSYIDTACTKHAPSMKRKSPTWANLSWPRRGPDDYYVFISANTFLLSVYRRELMWCDVMWCGCFCTNREVKQTQIGVIPRGAVHRLQHLRILYVGVSVVHVGFFWCAAWRTEEGQNTEKLDRPEPKGEVRRRAKSLCSDLINKYFVLFLLI